MKMNFSIVLIILWICVPQSYQANVADKLDFTESKETVTHTMKSPKIQGVRVTVDTTNLKGSAGLFGLFFIYLLFCLTFNKMCMSSLIRYAHDIKIIKKKF